MNVPGKIVDILADPVRNRVYMLRQDKNVVLIYDSTTLTPLMCDQQPCKLRTGNTPVAGMAITEDQRYLIVGNDHSQLASVFDLEALLPSSPILTPGAYPRWFGIGHGGIFATARFANSTNAPCVDPLFRVDFNLRSASVPSNLGIYCNTVPPDAALATSDSLNYILLATPNGPVATWEAASDLWVISRNDSSTPGGAIGAFSDNAFLVGNRILDQSLFPVTVLQTTTGSSAGAGVLAGAGLRTTTATPSGPGTIERVDLNALQTYNARSTSEAPVLSPESRDLVRVLLARQHDRVRSVLMSAGLRRAKADELTSLVVAVNQSLGVLSRAGSPAGELRSVVRATCAAVGDAVQRTGSGSA